MLLIVSVLLFLFAHNFGEVRLLVFLFFRGLNFRHLIFEVLLVEPRNSLSVLPEACTLDTVDVSIDTLTVLLAIFPLARVLPTILPRVDAEAVLLVVEIFALVLAAVLPRELTLAVHITVDPVTLIHFAVLPFVNADAINLVVLPISLVDGSVGVDVFAATVLGALRILTNIARLVGPGLASMAVLQIILPVAQI